MWPVRNQLNRHFFRAMRFFLSSFYNRMCVRTAYETIRLNAAGKSSVCRLINFCVQLNKASVPEKCSFFLIGQPTKLNKCVLHSPAIRFKNLQEILFIIIIVMVIENCLSDHLQKHSPLYIYVNVSYSSLAKIINFICAGTFSILLSYSVFSLFVSKCFRIKEHQQPQ